MRRGWPCSDGQATSVTSLGSSPCERRQHRARPLMLVVTDDVVRVRAKSQQREPSLCAVVPRSAVGTLFHDSAEAIKPLYTHDFLTHHSAN